MNNGTELLVNVIPRETRIALVDTGVLREVHIEREHSMGIVGNIYKGRVIRVLPGMQSAFVDIGLDKAAFLHASDIVSHTEYVVIEGEDEEVITVVKDIHELVHQGQDIIVQVIKDPIGTKGARLTTEITIPLRYLVFMPDNNRVGISQRILDEEERERLRSLVAPLADTKGGFIIRTVAEGVDGPKLVQDAQFLRQLWQRISDKIKTASTKSLIYSELGLAQRLLRDFIGTNISEVKIDSRLAFEQIKDFCNEFIPDLTVKLKLYSGPQPIFDIYNIEQRIKESLDKRINLKSGGYLIIEQTEAMTTIDINTGAFVGHRNLEETIFSTNIEATKIIAQQLQLRNLGGIIVIDFIDMQNEENQARVLEALTNWLAMDRVKTTVNEFSRLGLVEVTRKRTRESLERQLCTDCTECKGRGSVKTLETLCYEIIREIVRVSRLYESSTIVVYASHRVAAYLVNEESHGLLAEAEVFIGAEIQIKTEMLYSQEEFDVVVM